MGAWLRSWLTGLSAGLFALAALQVPGQHMRMMVERTALIAAYAMPDGTLREFCPGHDLGRDGLVDGHGRNLTTLACLACVLMAAPGLMPLLFLPTARIAATVATDLGGADSVAVRGLVWVPHRARAPPTGCIV